MADDGAIGDMMSIPEVRHLLQKEQKDRGELTYEQKLALDHADILDRIGGVTKARKLYKELTALDRISPAHAIKIVDTCPRTSEEVEAIFARDRQPLSKEDSDTIIRLVTDAL